ncbi:MAG: hybrid sensor histidine kinase/response regulator [Bacteroidales bacterium]|nr:hybrid sensor histidine kinase/response regulator [Bacteroidales bacterium]
MMSENELKQDYDFQSNVLIVDDIAENIQVLGNILDENDIEFSYATSGKEALEAITFNKPDLLLLDINMPEMSGFEVCEKLKKDPETKGIPIIFLTARTEQEDIVKGLTIGAVDYVTKPFNSKELISRVNTHLELSNSRKILNIKNEQLRKVNADMKEIIKTKDKFFSIIAHDLKGPFNTLLGFSELLLKEYDNRDPEENKEMITHIFNSAVHGFDLLNNLLEWSRSQTGRIEYEPQNFSLNDLIRQNILFISDAAYKKNIEVQSKIKEHILAFADRRMINTVVRNLISNALKFTEPGGKIILSYTKEAKFIEVCVSDTGMGIREENIPKLFNLTEGFSTRGTNNEQGTGLGLILCKEFVEKNGGKIWVESKYGEGSKFMFTIPAP